MKKYNKAIILIILLYVLLNKHFFYVLTVGNTRNYFWILKIINKYGYRKTNKIYKYSKENSIFKYFDTFEKNKIHKNLIMPIFDQIIYVNKYDKDYSTHKIYGKKNH